LDYLKKSDFEQIEAEYIRTTKNIQTEFYYEKIGFKLISANRGTKKYRLHLKNFSKIANNNYKIVFK
jgi:predicted enzyme involved in methoxymalonyl-ACP biosynthesis